MVGKRVYVAGTCDTKGQELAYVKARIAARGVPAVIVDLSTRESGGGDISAREVAAHHPGGAAAVFTGDRGSAVAAMADAFEIFIRGRDDLAGLIGLGGSGNTALVTQAMRALPVGVPKLMVSTVASANVAPYVGPSDIAMMYSVTDVAGLNRISRVILANAAHAIAGMVSGEVPAVADDKPALGLTMFGVTTPCVDRARKIIEGEGIEVVVFHATGVGGQSMEGLVRDGQVAGLLDLTTTELADELVGGILSAGPDRLEAGVRAGLPQVIGVGALDMVNFGPAATVPSRFAGRRFHVHNESVTLMRTTPDENAALGAWIVRVLSRSTRPAVVMLPLRGVSALDIAGGPFEDSEADARLFQTIASGLKGHPWVRVEARDEHINDPTFAAAAARNLLGLMGRTSNL